MQINPSFTLDETNTDDKYCYIDVQGKGTVAIKREDEGIVVDIFPFHVVDAPVASTWAHDNDLIQDELPVDADGCLLNNIMRVMQKQIWKTVLSKVS